MNKLPEGLPQELAPIIGAPPYFVTSAVVFQDIKQEDISPIVAFAHNPLFHREVLETLKQIVELSFGIVDAFESHLHRSSRTPA